MRRVLVTGANGFLGGHLVEHFLERTPWDVVAMVRPDEAGDAHHLLDLPTVATHLARVHVVCHDLRYAIEEETAERIGTVEAVAHLAGNTNVGKSLDDPRPFVLDNVVGTCNLLEYYRRYVPYATMVNLGSADVYGPSPHVICREWDTWHPLTPYAGTKAGQVALGMAYAASFGLPIVTALTIGLFGERQPPGRLFSTAIARLKRGLPVPVYPGASRTWLYVRDAAEAISFLLQRGQSGHVYNLSGSDCKENEEVVEAIAEIMGVPARIERLTDPPRPGHAGKYQADASKLARLGWSPRTPFPIALRQTVEYTLAHPDTLWA